MAAKLLDNGLARLVKGLNIIEIETGQHPYLYAEEERDLLKSDFTVLTKDLNKISINAGSFRLATDTFLLVFEKLNEKLAMNEPNEADSPMLQENLEYLRSRFRHMLVEVKFIREKAKNQLAVVGDADLTLT